MENNLKAMNIPHKSKPMGITMKIKQGLVAIALATAALSVQATPATTYYIYDESGHVIGEYDANGNPVQEHIYLGDRPVAVVQNGNAATLDYVTTDQLNTPRVVTDSNQDVEWNWTSDPFGNGQPTGSFTYNLRFPGQYYDAETGHNYNYFRDYDPGTGRYIESDPIGLHGGNDTFLYVDANPLNSMDSQGLMPRPLLPGFTNTRACNRDEMTQCMSMCGGKGVQSCRVSQTFRIKTIKNGLAVWQWVDGPLSCSCNDEQLCPLKSVKPSPWLILLPFLIPWPGNPLYAGF